MTKSKPYPTLSRNEAESLIRAKHIIPAYLYETGDKKKRFVMVQFTSSWKVLYRYTNTTESAP